MAQQIIDVGTSPNDNTGDPLRTALEKANANFTELYQRTTVTASGDGAVPRTVAAKVAERLTPRDFGVVGDGTTDDTVALQAAVDAAAAQKRPLDMSEFDVIRVTDTIRLSADDANMMSHREAGTNLRLDDPSGTKPVVIMGDAPGNATRFRQCIEGVTLVRMQPGTAPALRMVRVNNSRFVRFGIWGGGEGNANFTNGVEAESCIQNAWESGSCSDCSGAALQLSGVPNMRTIDFVLGTHLRVQRCDKVIQFLDYVGGVFGRGCIFYNNRVILSFEATSEDSATTAVKLQSVDFDTCDVAVQGHYAQSVQLDGSWFSYIKDFAFDLEYVEGLTAQGIVGYMRPGGVFARLGGTSTGDFARNMVFSGLFSGGAKGFELRQGASNISLAGGIMRGYTVAAIDASAAPTGAMRVSPGVHFLSNAANFIGMSTLDFEDSGTGPARLLARGSDADVGIDLITKGGGGFQFCRKAGDDLIARVIREAGTDGQSYIDLVAYAANVAVRANGTATDLDLQLLPRGAGKVRFGSFQSTADAPIAGYIEVKDAAGNIRKLAVIS